MGTAIDPSATVVADSAGPAVRAFAGARIVSVDLLRGLVMVIMALDHTREYFTNTNFSPEDLGHTSGAMFFARFITHFCAPTFSFLAGTGAFLAVSRGKTVQEVSQFFWTRGIWLVFLELTFIGFGWFLHAVWICGSDLGAGVVDGGDGRDCAASSALDRRAGSGDDRGSQPA